MADQDMAKVLDALITKISSIQAGGGGISATQLEEILKKQAGDSAEAFGRMLIPENKVHPGISVYSHPEGELKRPKTKLSRETIFCNARQYEDQLTPAEILAFNDITVECEARGGLWWAKILKNGTKDVLWVHVPCADLDDRMSLPSILAILTELKQGPTAVDLDTLAKQMAELKEQLAKAQAAAKK
jgi:hypothetical protein